MYLKPTIVLTLTFMVTGVTLGQAAPKIVYKGPITITKGGTYRGNWQSLSPDVPAVTVATSAPVIIEYSNLRSRGHQIYSAFRRANITVRHVRAEAISPDRPLRQYKYAGRFIALEEFESARIENNEIIGTSGMYFRDYKGKASKGQTVKIFRNKVRNVDGRYSTGVGKFSSSEHRLVQFVQFNDVKRIPGAEIAWNEVINEPGKSRVEENINLYLSSGLPSSYISIHNNYIQGAFATDPHRNIYSGGGMNLADGSSKTLDGASSYIKAFNNQIVGTSNIGIAVSAGHHIDVFNNRIISSGYLPDGRTIRAQNVGLYVWDMHGNKKFNTFSNIRVYNNVVGWWLPLQGRTNNFWFPDCPRNAQGVSACANNTAISGRVTQTMEAQEYRRWQDKLRAANVRLGPQR